MAPAEPPVTTTVSGGAVYGVAGAGTVIIENFYANRGPESPPARPESEGPLPPCPYPGLSYFGPQDRAIFFGRKQAVAGLMQAVPRHGLTALVGASGSGKSSVVLAGLAPSLADGGGWTFTYFRVGIETDRHPFIALSRALVPLLSDDEGPVRRLSDISDLAKRLESGDITLANVLGECRQRHRGKRILLIADQFEEVFTLVGDESVRQRFIDVLLSGFAGEKAGTAPDACLLLTLRADFYNMVLRYRPLSDAIQGHVENLGPMTPDELREAIEGPAGSVRFEGGLVDTLLDDVASRPGNLPLLQFALREMWARQENGCITHQIYRDIGRVEGALAQRAHEVFEKITKGGSDAPTVAMFRRLFTRLVTLGEGAQDTRRVVSRGELGDDAWNLAQRLAGEDNRLVVTGAAAAGNETAEVVHEALIRHWPDLVGWVDRDRAFQTWLRQIRPRVEEWLTNRSDEGTLLRGGALVIAEEWLGSRGDELAPEEQDYIRSSIQARDNEIHEREERVKAARRRQILVLIAASIAAFVFAALAATAVWQWNEAKHAASETATANKTISLVQRIARHTGDIDSKPELNTLLGLEAAQLTGVDQSSKLAAIDAVRQQLQVIGGYPLLGHEKPTRAAAYSRSGRWLATGSDDGAIRLWDLAKVEPESVLIFAGTSAVHALAFSADENYLLSGDEAGILRSWRLAGGKADSVHESRPGYGAIKAMAADPNGKWVAFATQSGNVCIWEVTNDGLRERPCSPYDKGVFDVRFSAHGRWLAAAATGEDAPVALWDFSLGSPPDQPRILRHVGYLFEAYLQAIAFSADEKRLAAAYGRNTEVWDLSQEDPPQHVVGRGQDSDWITSIDLSPDGRWLATASGDTTVKLWDLAGSSAPMRLKEHSGTVRSVVFSDDGKWMATAGDDATARLWDLSDLRTIRGAPLHGQDLPIHRIIFSPGPPSHLVAVGDDPHARLWTLSSLSADPTVLKAGQGDMVVALSADGGWIASAIRQERALLIWSIKDPRLPIKKLPLASAVASIAFSADGRWLAVETEKNRTLRLWRLPDLATEFELDAGDSPGPQALGFSPDGRWLVSGTWDSRTVNVWDVSGETPSLRPSDACLQSAGVRGLAFSTDGYYAVTGEHGHDLVTGEYGAAAHIWDLRTAHPCEGSRTLAPHGDAVEKVAISSDDRWAATASFDAHGRLWDLQPDEPKQVGDVTLSGRVTTTAISRDGHWAAFGSLGGDLAVFDLRASGQMSPVIVQAHIGGVYSLAFTPDSDSAWLITSGGDRTARVWDPADMREAPVVLRGHEAPARIAGISSDSRILATYGADGTIRLWHLHLPDLVAIACHTAGRSLTPTEVHDFLGSETSNLPCAEQLKGAQ